MISIFPEEPTVTDQEDFLRLIRGYFAPDGPLSRSKDYEYRPQQQEMAGLVATSLQSSRPLLVEAGTGVGKSLAYLLPAIEFGLNHKRKALISTHTINLQEQLLYKDLPNAQRILGRQFKAELFKGRSNYLCMRRLKHAFSSSHDLFDASGQTELKALWEWSQATTNGSLSDLPVPPSARVWGQVCSEGQLCTARTCPPESGCFYQQAKRRALEAEVLVVNHTLFFTLLASMPDEQEHRGFLFPNDFVILDEAHTLEDVAARQLGLNLSESSLHYQLHRLFHPRTKRGYFTVLGDTAGRMEVERLLEHSSAFYGGISEACHFQGMAKEFRVRQPGLAENSLGPMLEALNLRLADTLGRLEQGSQQRLELQDLAVRLRDYRLGLDVFLDQGAEKHVYWVEQRGESGSLSLRNAPVNLAERLGKIFFREGRTCVLTSATLGTGDRNMAYFRGRIGAKNADIAQIGSPFDFKKQMKLYLIKSMPEPSHKDYEEQMERYIRYFLDLSRGRAFVLFTNYRLMESMAGRLEAFCSAEGWPLHVQGKSLARSQLLKNFKEHGQSVLFGTESFWTGVDVPGEALSNVIITRLPFAVPDQPLIQARMEAVEEAGQNAFSTYYVPEAILKLRQGIGRLIRSKKDKGICVILDNRVLTKSYGKQFLAALPNAHQIILETLPD